MDRMLISGTEKHLDAEQILAHKNAKKQAWGETRLQHITFHNSAVRLADKYHSDRHL